MDDREVVAAIAAGSPAGMADAYDKYASDLYDYCQWILEEPVGAAEALRDTFVIAATTIGDLADGTRLRPWLYAATRHECRRRPRVAAPAQGGRDDAAGQPAGADLLPDFRDGLPSDELRQLIRDTLAGLPSREREAIELNFRHNLYDDDLAEALGISRRRARSLTARARARLEKAFGTLLVARAGRESCPELGGVLADWDGRLTREARDLTAAHVERCQACASRQLDGLRSAALTGLRPLAPLPPGLREQVLTLCTAATPDAATYRRQATRRAESGWAAHVRLASIRGNPGAVTAAVVIVLWLVAAVAVTLLTLAGSHAVRGATVRPGAPLPSSSPAAAAVTTTAPATVSPRPSPSPSPSQSASPFPSATG
jgi:RNA polymerase sigma factor (sigma-70 family)